MSWRNTTLDFRLGNIGSVVQSMFFIDVFYDSYCYYIKVNFFRNLSTLYTNQTAACVKKGLLNNTVSLFHP